MCATKGNGTTSTNKIYGNKQQRKFHTVVRTVVMALCRRFVPLPARFGFLWFGRDSSAYLLGGGSYYLPPIWVVAFGYLGESLKGFTWIVPWMEQTL